ncbi:nicotinamidase-like [Osmia bicornis bicornis]|uniref:nicotinamidase-like n=1 Tax=Osmia bicornis bicornis TaxID=1437191 RepID=UPI0010F5B388|nr:nicotinamidase-like [Osmia bicornis bicornis]XP_029041448.1 nicotinamidase-like [Osmia bicornis bicornis]XP_029041449.1 nicotinamidase-like [Osmia bicornis bicornis]XP_029041451.1 nicotinamidase-like [Osmia bicornis bicornis]XP_029041452.1 nicotinamidase-like [Osmia bicornis bicornis]
MAARGTESVTNSFCGKKRRSMEKFLTEFDLLKEETGLNYTNFHSICAALFQPHELEKEERRLEDIFNLFDGDNDGILKGQEWKIFIHWLRVIFEPITALLVVDVQNDFIDGSLALRRCGCNQDGVDVVEPINRLIRKGHFDNIIYSLDWHPENHISFHENLHLRELHLDSKVTKENAKPLSTVIFAEPYMEQILWPKHCVMNTWGAQLHKDLVIVPHSEQVRKGQHPELEAYSVFFDNNSKNSVELQTILRKSGVTHVFVCGLAYDVCVKATCLDGLRLGYALAVIDDCCRGVDTNNIETTKELIIENGGLITDSNTVLSLVNEGKRSLIMSHQSAKAMTSILSSGTPANDSETIDYI